MKETCRLCLKEEKLCNSHIIPKFIFRDFKKTSATGKIRSSENINKRVQDGLKTIFLCKNCEQEFSSFESYFKNNIYDLVQNGEDSFVYNDQFLKFGVSLTWRVLQYSYEKNNLKNFDKVMICNVKNTLNIWRNFLIGKENNLQGCDLDFYNFNGQIIGFDKKNVHRYFDRTIECDVINNGEISIVYIKLPSILMLGYISNNNEKLDGGSRIKIDNGIINPGNFIVPYDISQYIESRMDYLEKCNNYISDNQKYKILLDYKKTSNLEKSSTYKAFVKDTLVGSNEKNDLSDLQTGYF